MFCILLMKKGFIKFSRKLFRIPEPKSPRRSFPKYVKQKVRKIQMNRCAHCHRYNPPYEFDHIRSRMDNSLQNCQMLCVRCHTIKTIFERKKGQRRSHKGRFTVFLFLFIMLFNTSSYLSL